MQCSAAFERAVHQIFRAPLSAQEVADIFFAYSDCAQPVTKKQERKYNKRHDVESDGSVAEDVHHTQESGSTLADAAVWQQHPMEPWRLFPTWELSWLEVSGASSSPSYPVLINKPSFAK